MSTAEKEQSALEAGRRPGKSVGSMARYTAQEERDGGFAFPLVSRIREGTHHEIVTTDDGMTMRQWYKGQALAGLCARMGTSGYYDLEHGCAFGQSEARVAGIMADAMLAEDAEREDAPQSAFTEEELAALTMFVTLGTDSDAFIDDPKYDGPSLALALAALDRIEARLAEDAEHGS